MQCERQCVAQELQYAMRRAGQNPTDVEVRDGLNFLFKSICQHLDLGERDNSAFSPFFFCKCNFLCVQPLNNKMDNMFFEVGFLQDPFIPMQAYWQRELCRFKIWSTRLMMAPPRSTSRLIFLYFLHFPSSRTFALSSRRRQGRWTQRHISRWSLFFIFISYRKIPKSVRRCASR